MVITIVILIVLLVLMVAIAIEGYRDKSFLFNSLEDMQLALEQEKLSHEETRVQLWRSQHPEPPLTAAEIVEKATKRLKLRRSLSEIAKIDESKHQKKQKKHEKLVKNIEQVRPRV